MDTREKVVNLLKQNYGDANQLTDELILIIENQPIGMKAKKVCGWYPHGNILAESCPDCHGTGVISRDIPMKEAAEILRIMAMRAKMKGENLVILPSGEKVSLG